MRRFSSISLLLLAWGSSVVTGESLPRAESWELRLPDAVTSFGACESGGYLYVYSGHVGEAHQYSRDNHSLKFSRLKLGKGKTWESLPMDIPMQSGIIFGYEGRIYRVGGTRATNARNEPANLRSLDSVAVYDPKKENWQALTPLPEPRSSHEAVVHAGRIYVVGGWNMGNGVAPERKWHRHGLVADLGESPLSWKKLPQSDWVTRAHSAAILKDRLYVMGGLDPMGMSNAVRVLDLKTMQWSKGPDLPSKGSLKGFGSAACVQGGRLFYCGYTPFPWQLTTAGKKWEKAGFRLENRRFFQRMVPIGDRRILFAGGADADGHTDLIETFDLPTGPVLQNRTAEWPGFRGDGTSVSSAKGLPVKWSDEKNIAWRVALTGYGQSSPVTWKGRVFTTSKEGDEGGTLLVQCHETQSGKAIWTRIFPASTKIKRSGYVSQAAPTPSVDADGLYLFFETGDLFSLTHEGELRWKRNLPRDFGPFKGNHGLGTSLIQSGSRLGLMIDHDGPSYLLCIDKATGKDAWKIDRPARVSWSTPTLALTADREELFISSNGVLEAYDFSTGKNLWRREGIEGNTVASPAVANGLVMIGSSVRDNCFAVDRKEGREKAWTLEETTCSFGSPLAVDNRIYYVNRAGVAFCHDLKTGKKLWHQRVAGSCWASPIAADGRVYFFAKEGGATVMEGGGSEKVLAENPLTITGRIYGVAVVDGAFLVRTGKELIRISR